MAYVIVLAEYAAEVAAGKEYRARPASGTGFQPVKTRPRWPCHEDAFLAEMGAYGADHRQAADAAKADLPFTAVDFALARAKSAGICIIPQLLDGFAERTDISRQKRHNFILRMLYKN